MSDIRIADLHKSFDGQVVLHGINLTIPRGTLLTLLGPSGSGKTTLLRLLCGFERADSGTIEIGDRRVTGDGVHLPPEERRIGYVPQEGALFPYLSVAENIVFGLPRAQRRAHHRVSELLELVGLPASCAERTPQDLSGGQQQRVALARALAPAPTLIMLDEPFSSLDAPLRLETREAVAKALAAANTTAVIVTHDQAEALSLGHLVAVLWRGRILQVAGAETVYRRPASCELAAFVGEAVILPGVAFQGRARCALGELPLNPPAIDGPVDIMVRPEQIVLMSENEGEQTASNALWQDATVGSVSFRGRQAEVLLSLNSDNGMVGIRARVPGYRSPKVGARVKITVEGEAVAYAKSSVID